MHNFENLDVFEILITQKLLKCLKDPFLRSALIYIYIYINHSLVTNSNRMHKKEAVIRTEDEVDNRSAKENKE